MTTPILLSNQSIIEKFKQKSILSLGRSPDCDIILDHISISRVHAKIEKKSPTSYIIYDQGAINGIYINGKRITGIVEISPADTILIGQFSLTLQGESKHLAKELAIKTIKITKTYSNGKTALHETTLDIHSQSMTAIMGPSGCGKSTLLKSLNGDAPPTTGEVYICGLELTQNYEYIKSKIGYIPQDDIVHRQLTVSESLRYAAKLRLNDISESEISAKIDDVLNALSITHIKKQLVGEVSGGQRKRIAIAMELLTDPLILFLDEPTSPLDPQTIEDFLNCLRSLVNLGTTVLMVTHKPEDLHFVDAVIFMAEGGYLTYHGSRRDYLSYFGVDHVVQIYANLVPPYSQKWIQQYQTQHPFIKQDPPTPWEEISLEKKDPSLTSQYLWLTRRYLNIKLNDRLNTALMIGQAPVIALLICMIFSEITISVLFMISISAVWFGTNNAVKEIVDESSIYKRERMYNQAISTYVLSKVTGLGIFSALQSMLFVIIINAYFDGQSVSFKEPFEAMIWLWGLSMCASCMGLLLSAVVNNTEKVMTLLPLALIPQVLLAGVIAPTKNELIECISYFTISRWGTEGFCNIQNRVYEMNQNVVTWDIMKRNLHSSYWDFFPDLNQKMSLSVIWLLGLSILFVSLTAYVLKRKDSVKIN
jgi:ABC-type multidrug transport system ATPase subunit